MPKHHFITDLEPGGVASTYLVRESKLLKTIKGDDYLALTLADRTGEIAAKIWQAPPEVSSQVKSGTYLDISGRVETYRERKQIIIESFEVHDAAVVDVALYREAAPVQPADIYKEVAAMLDGMRDPWLVKLAHAYLDDESFRKAFYEWPAAKRMHHPYLHGLLEHVHSVMNLGRALAAHYSWVDGDLVLMGLFLHDSGKVVELVSAPAPDYSVQGELLGHITIGICILHEKANAIEGFPAPRLVQLKHIILSHHERPEFGSPKEPMFPEAQLVHTVEMLDAKMNAFLRESRLPPESRDETGEMRFSKLLKRRIYTLTGAMPDVAADESEPDSAGDTNGNGHHAPAKHQQPLPAKTPAKKAVPAKS